MEKATIFEPRVTSITWQLCPHFASMRAEVSVTPKLHAGLTLINKKTGRIRADLRRYGPDEGAGQTYLSLSYSNAHNLGLTFGLIPHKIVQPFIGVSTNLFRPGLEGHAGLAIEMEFC